VLRGLDFHFDNFHPEETKFTIAVHVHADISSDKSLELNFTLSFSFFILLFSNSFP